MVAVLGVSAHYHDAAAAIVVDGRIVAAAQEERFSRTKHDASLPRRAMAYCLEAAGLSAFDLAAAVYYEKPLRKLDRILETHLSRAPRGLSSFLRTMPKWLGERLLAPEEIADALPGFRGKLLLSEHHASHAASAFFPSPFDAAAILTIDGVGEWATGSFGMGRDDAIELWEESRFPHSLGLVYAAFTSYLGFEPNDGEYKVMGLAPYGAPSFLDRIRSEVVRVHEDGSVEVDAVRLGLLEGRAATDRRLAEVLGGPARRVDEPIDDRHRDVAASIQALCEEAVLRQARHVHARTGLDRICLAGGVALNAVANGRVLREGPFADVFVQPAATDAGGALGAALLASAMLGDRVRRPDPLRGARLGPAYDEARLCRALREAKLPANPIQGLAEEVALRLERGEVVGLFTDRMELGPRALGSRSILADPRQAKTRDEVNRRIKFREGFRPFAPAVLAERASEAYEIDRPMPFMTFVVPVRESARASLAATTHVDGTARVQTVRAEDHPELHAILEAFHARTGCTSLLQTSFNLAGEPIVCTPEDAIRTWLRSGMDALAMPPFLVDSKKGAVEPPAPSIATPRPAAWKRALRRVGSIPMTILLALVFLLVLTPIALARRAAGRDPIRRRAGRSTFVARRARTFDLASLARRG
jgi:carbamoyltransferase